MSVEISNQEYSDCIKDGQLIETARTILRNKKKFYDGDIIQSLMIVLGVRDEEEVCKGASVCDDNNIADTVDDLPFK